MLKFEMLLIKARVKENNMENISINLKLILFADNIPYAWEQNEFFD